MGKIWKRNCDWCGKWYEGRGARFCSRLCPQGESADLPIGDKERDFLQPVHIHITPKVYTAAKPSSDEITSVHYGDIHFPHHDPRALDIRNQILDRGQCQQLWQVDAQSGLTAPVGGGGLLGRHERMVERIPVELEGVGLKFACLFDLT